MIYSIATYVDDVILSGGEAGARDPTSADSTDAADEVSKRGQHQDIRSEWHPRPRDKFSPCPTAK